MPLFGPAERRTRTARLVHGTIYVVLTLGAITMVYPFALMLGASVTTDLDFEDWRIIPAYLTDDVALYRKWMDDRYGDYFTIARHIHRFDAADFRFLEAIPDVDVHDPAVQRRVQDWLDCMGEMPVVLLQAFYVDLWRTRPTHQKFTAWLTERYGDDIEALNKKFDTAYTTFNQVSPSEVALTHKLRLEDVPLRREYLEFRKTLPREDLIAVLATDGFVAYVERHIGQAEQLNQLLGTDHEALNDMIFPTERPAEAGPWRDLWDRYVTKRFPLSLVRIEGDFDKAYRAFLAGRYHDYDRRVADHNAGHGTDLPALDKTVYPKTMPLDDLHFADWILFTDQHVPPGAKRLTTVEGIWRDWLRKKYEVRSTKYERRRTKEEGREKSARSLPTSYFVLRTSSFPLRTSSFVLRTSSESLDRLNDSHGTEWKTWAEVMPPRAETDVVTFWRNAGAIRTEFFLRNYRLVLDYILFHGRAVFNTFVLVVMTVLGHLTVQPLAAYGLSRFRLRYAHKILLFLLATMAFPAEVAMIPNFLLIKELGLLNTYWALVLPGLASGMGIFLLKGYFDSLPQELYEAAMMDGASELRMFVQITLQLSKPILAVIALGSFVGAYGGFMWAFLICQKPHMWTMMVFLWQLGHENYPSVWMASLVIAAVPTLIVFIFCQNIILRGIIIPTMK